MRRADPVVLAERSKAEPVPVSADGSPACSSSDRMPDDGDGGRVDDCGRERSADVGLDAGAACAGQMNCEGWELAVVCKSLHQPEFPTSTSRTRGYTSSLAARVRSFYAASDALVQLYPTAVSESQGGVSWPCY